MGLSSDLISQFVKVTKDTTKSKKESSTYGKIVKEEGKPLQVILDGTTNLTPILEPTEVEVEDGDRVAVTIRNHSAIVTGNLESPAARLGNVEQKFDDLVIDTATIETLVADNATIKETLFADDGVFNDLYSDEGVINTLKTNSAKIEDLETNALTSEKADLKYVSIGKTDIGEAYIHYVNGTYSDFVVAIIDKLTSSDASIDELAAKDVEITGKLDAVEADIDKLEADVADIDKLEADVADINTLIFGSSTGNTMHASFANAVIALLGSAWIKSAMVESVSADKITAGDIITNAVRVMSEDGRLVISDETLQISDGNRVRVQIGKDDADDYSINVWDQNGNLMFSKGGITDAAIKDAIIRNDMVSDDANISAHKLNIDSLFEVINDDNSKTINSTKIQLDDKGQMLNVAFESMRSNVDELDGALKSMDDDVKELQNGVSSQGTQIGVIQGQIASKVWQQDIDEAIGGLGGETGDLYTKYSELLQEVDSVKTTVAGYSSAINNKADASQVTEVSNKVSELEVDLDGFQSTVSDTYATKNELANTKSEIDEDVLAVREETASLTERVEKAETSITQNAGAIALTATKTELNSAKSEVIATASADAQSKADKAKSEAVSVASADAQSKADKAKSDAISAASIDAQAKANQAKADAVSEAVSAASEDAQERADKAKSDAIAAASTDAQEKANQAKSDAISTASADAQTKADKAKSDAISAASADAQTKANKALSDANANTANQLKSYSTTVEMNAAITASADSITSSVQKTYATIETVETLATSDELDGVQSSVEQTETRVIAAETLIQQLSDSISMLVTDADGQSLMTQTDTGWTFSTGEIQKALNGASESLNNLVNDVGDVNSAIDILQKAVDDLGVLNEYVKIGTYEDEPCIELGETDSDFKLLITNTRIMFREGTSVPAYITNQSLHITKAVIEEEIQQGEFVWKVRANGNMGLMWTGDVIIPFDGVVYDVAVAPRSQWTHTPSTHNTIIGANNAAMAIGVSTANDFVFTDRESNPLYVMPVPNVASKVSVTISDGMAYKYGFMLYNPADGLLHRVLDSGWTTENEYSFPKGVATYITISAVTQDGAFVPWGYDDTQVTVTFYE